MYAKRLRKLRKKFSFWGITHFLITNPTDIFYLTGFRGVDSALLVGRRSAALYTDGRYTAEVAQTTSVRCVLSRKKLVDARNDAFKTEHAILAYDGDFLTHSDFLRLKQGVKACRLKNLSQPTTHVRMIKDSSEIRCMQKAVSIAEQAFTHTLATIKTGMTEAEIAATLEYTMRTLGAQAPSFDTIAAIGPNSALPHATPTLRKITKNCLLLMDFGARYGGYDSDQTRMIIVGKCSAKQRKIIDIVQRAQDAAVSVIRPGIECKEVDAAAREVIAQAGYGPEFKHGTGHGVGIDIHEAPSVGPTSRVMLQEGMVITVEPGIYLDNAFGVRLEEMVLVTKTGGERLTKLPMVLER